LRIHALNIARLAHEETTMATIITEECINCGACEPECPNEAISEGEDIYVIDPERCTECVGFHGDEACQSVCPVECCIPNPDIRENEIDLLMKAKALHESNPDDPVHGLDPDALDQSTSRFRNDDWINAGRD